MEMMRDDMILEIIIINHMYFETSTTEIIFDILDAVSPLLIQLRIAEDSVHDPGSMCWRIGDHGSDNQSHLTLDVVHVALVAGDHGQIASSLVVETKVLAEGLRTEQLESLRHKEPD